MKQNKILAAVLLMLCALLLSACSASNNAGTATNWPGAAADGDVVYTATGSQIEAVREGKLLWSYPVESGKLQFYAAPAVDDTRVYAGDYNNRLYILNKEDGSDVAVISVGNNKNKIIASPILTEDSVIVLSSGGMVSSYPVDGTADPNWQTVLNAELWVKPAYDNGTLYVASMDKKMNLIDAKTGELKQSIAISGAIMSDPVLADGKLYFSTLAKEVDVIDLTDGSIQTLITTDNEIWGSPLVWGDKLIAADMSGYIYCADLAEGKQLWKSDRITEERYGFIASPVDLDGEYVLLVDETGTMSTFDAEGKSVAQRMLAQSLATTPVKLDNGSVALVPMSSDGQVKVFTPELKEDWVYARVSEKEQKEDK